MSDFYATATHVLPETASDGRMHVLDDTCWCHPVIDSDVWQIQHRLPPYDETGETWDAMERGEEVA